MPQLTPLPANPLVIFSLQWFESWRFAAELSKRNLEEMRRMRNRMFQEMSLCIESYMRSPAFLELMRYNLAMMGQPNGRLLGGAASTSEAVTGHLQGRPLPSPSASVPVIRHPKMKSVGGAPPPSAALIGHSKGMSAGRPPSGSMARLGHPKDRSVGDDPSASPTFSKE
jgi:hypothetical protein